MQLEGMVPETVTGDEFGAVLLLPDDVGLAEGFCAEDQSRRPRLGALVQRTDGRTVRVAAGGFRYGYFGPARIPRPGHIITCVGIDVTGTVSPARRVLDE